MKWTKPQEILLKPLDKRFKNFELEKTVIEELEREQLLIDANEEKEEKEN